MSDFTIYIPTSNRVTKQLTLETIGDISLALLSKVVLVVPEDQVDDYDDEHGLTCEIVGCPAKGIADTRQWIIENSRTRYLFQLDDDMAFFKRGADKKLTKCTGLQLEEMFDTLLSWLTDCYDMPLVGLSARQGNNHVDEDFKEATRQMNFHGIDRDFFLENNFKMNVLPVMEDFHTVLSLLTNGYRNRVMYNYCWNQRGSGAEGGCSDYRDNALQSEAAHDLEFMFPNFVTVVTKKSKSSWKGMEERTDVRVQWKKAYEYGTQL